MRWSIDEVAAATGGRVAVAAGHRGDQPVVDVVSIDSRRVGPGSLFVPIRAERDGHAWIADAVRSGAVAYLFEADGHEPAEGGGAAAIEVADTGRALLDLGRAARRLLAAPVVGITGSVGKTSTKDLAAAALARRWRVAASERSFNNELGVPLTLTNAGEGTELAVVEMGARGPGHIALLCDVARPTAAVVTAVAAAHTEQFGTLADVAEAKAELVDALPPDGVAILNADDPLVARMAARAPGRVLRYSAAGSPDVDVSASDVRVDEELRAAFVLSSPWGSGPVHLAARGRHQVPNALAAATVALHHGVGWEDVVEALGAAAVSQWRMELVTTAGGARVLNDAYNANPASMAAALHALADLPVSRRLAVLGPMAELGAGSEAEHRAVAALAAELGVDVVAVGTGAYGSAPVVAFDEVVDAVGPIGEGDAVLVKASRVAGFERLAALLAR